jgi:hypothetical protein
VIPVGLGLASAILFPDAGEPAVPGERDMLLKCGNNASCQSLRLAVQSAAIAFTACIAEISLLAIMGGSS